MNQTHDVKVSIIVPLYNATLYLEQCVRSLMSQTYRNIEYLFIDDASNDGSVDALRTLIEEYPARNGQCRIFLNDNNKGVAYCRRLCMQKATGEYLIHVDSDDYIDPMFIEKMLTKALSTQSDLVICNIADVYVNKIKVNTQFEKVEKNELIKRLLIGTMHNALWNKLVKRSIITDNNLFPDDSFRLLEDKSISFRMAYFANKVEFVNEPIYYYRKRQNSLSDVNQRVLMPMLKEILRLVDDFFKTHPTDEIIESGIKAFKVGVSASLLIYKPDDEDLKSLLKEMPISIIKTNTYIPFYYRVALYAHKLHQPWVVSIIRKIIDYYSGYYKSKKTTIA